MLTLLSRLCLGLCWAGFLFQSVSSSGPGLWCPCSAELLLCPTVFLHLCKMKVHYPTTVGQGLCLEQLCSVPDMVLWRNSSCLTSNCSIKLKQNQRTNQIKQQNKDQSPSYTETALLFLGLERIGMLESIWSQSPLWWRV